MDRAKLAEARAALGARSSSEAIDLALTEVVRRARLRSDVDAYRRVPPGAGDRAFAEISPDWRSQADDTDWEALWPEA